RVPGPDSKAMPSEKTIMSILKYPTNFVSGIYYLRSIQETATATYNDAVDSVNTVEASLSAAQSFYLQCKYSDAIQSYKNAQSLIYRLLHPSFVSTVHLSDDAVMLPVGKDVEIKIAEAGLKLAEAMQPHIPQASSPIGVLGVNVPDYLA